MDPDETLREIRAVVSKVTGGMDGAKSLDVLAELERVTAACAALDEWLSRGGFLPGAWAESRGGVGSY